MSDVSSSQQDGEECCDDICGDQVTYEDMCASLALPTVPRVTIGIEDGPLSETHEAVQCISMLTFVREFVSKSKPCVICGLTNEWPALKKWRNDAYVFGCDASNREVTVALTPNGRADCVTDITFLPKDDSTVDAESERVFMAPAEVKMHLPQLLTLIQQAKSDSILAHPLAVDLCGASAHRKYRPCKSDPLIPIPYCQLQNNCLETEFQHLKVDITNSVRALGETAFGCPCDAANLWIGTSLSVTSMHQDWYENLYAVVRGTKEFLMIPPWEAALARNETVRSATYLVEDKAEGYAFKKTIAFEAETINWIGEDLEDSPEHDFVTRNPDLVHANAVRVDVNAGEVLYLPTMWLHRVAQREEPSDDTCVMAVNYWYDMSMDGPLYHLVQHVTSVQREKAKMEEQSC